MNFAFLELLEGKDQYVICWQIYESNLQLTTRISVLQIVLYVCGVYCWPASKTDVKVISSKREKIS